MKKGKRVLSIFIIGVFLIVCISLVNAGLKDWLGFGDDTDLEGELPTGAQANIRIAAPAVSPNITYISPILNSAGNTELSPGTTTDFKFYFLVKQGTFGSIANLPGAGQMTNRVRANFTRTGEATVRTFSGDCSWENDGADFKNYSCIIPMQYYDTPITSPPNWTLRLQIADINNRWSVPVNNSRTFGLKELRAFDRSPTYINWTNPPVIAGDSNTEANNVLTISNQGNVDILVNNLQINATDVIGESGGIITAKNFSANDLGTNNYCNVANQFTHNVYVGLNFALNRGPGATDSLGFCILKVPDVVAQNFTNSGWDIKLT